MPDKEETQSNRLIKEKSPYLLQHAYNPVDWYPWGDEAFARAKKENKPVFLSIGYSTCHWCHVMAEESFSNAEIAEILNEHFVAIKVDREERPDIDSIYMKAVIAMGANGGWPLTVFLTPDKKPFYGGTYFPPEDRWGMPGFKSVLLSIQRNWQEERKKVLLSADSITQALKAQSQLQANLASSLDKAVLKDAYEHFKNNFDIDYGGFSYAPKFPTPHNLYFLLRYSKHENNLYSLEMVEKTLTAMGQGAIRDHLGGGFHRYSTDNKWLLPHFEKMLYDQALIGRAYLEAYQLTKKQEYREVAEEVLGFVLTQMTDREGGFYTAYDADSFDPQDKKHKKEGAFYIWGKNEITNILGKKEAEIFSYYFGIEDNGNIKQDPHGEFGKKNIIYLARTFKETGEKFNIDPVKARKIINRAKRKLLKVRNNRPRPHLDDKILTDWNGLMISTFSFA